MSPRAKLYNLILTIFTTIRDFFTAVEGSLKNHLNIEELARIAPVYISCYPNAGLPNPMSETGYDEMPETTARLIEDFAKNGFVNIVGGCCGTTPAHIRAIANAVKNIPPRKLPIEENIEAANV